MLPVFLLGASTDLVRADLGVGETAIGAAATSLFVVATLAASTIGRVTERIGAGRALRSGVLLSAVVVGGIGLIDAGFAVLLALVATAGLAVCFVDTGAALAFSDRVAVDRQGTAFGIKEASIPAASLLAGVGLPLVATELGWRTLFAVALVLPIGVLLALPRQPGRSAGARRRGAVRAVDTTPEAAVTEAPTTAAAPGTTDGDATDDATTDSGTASNDADDGDTAGSDAAGSGPDDDAPGLDAVGPPTPRGDRTTVRFAIGVGFGTGAATAAATFLVPALSRTGVPPARAGTVLAVASVASILTRLAVGRWADRPTARPARAVATLLAGGVLGAVTLASAGGLPDAVAALGAVVLLASGWGWTGLAFLAVVRARPHAPAVAAGIVLTGLSAGGAAGPLVFGALADRGSYALAWWLAAAALAVGAAATGGASTRLDAARADTGS